MAKKRTRVFGWTDSMTIQTQMQARLIANGADETAINQLSPKTAHKKRCAMLIQRNLNKGGCQSLSRLHPDHPSRGRSIVERFEAGRTQRFVP